MVTNKIKVAWLGSGFIGRPASGTAQTARKAIMCLNNDHYDEVEVTLIVKSQKEYEDAEADSELARCKIILLDYRKRKIFASSRQYYRFSWVNRKTKIFDVIHFSVPRVYPFFYCFPARNFVATFHAGGDVTVPADKFVLSRYIYNLIIKLQWKKFTAIIGDSEFAVKEIASAYNIPIDKISRVFLGSDNYWKFNTAVFEKVSREITVVGRWQKYKNLHTAVNAISELNQTLDYPYDVKLVGKSNQLGKNLVQESINTFTRGKLTIINYLPDTELAKLYRETSIVIHPSINEGFGLPAFEAFGEGSVIIVHRGTPASELLENFPGVIVEDLSDIQGVKRALSRVGQPIKIDVVQRRKYLRDIGATWSEMAKNYLEIYKKVLLNQKK